jgi:hypothetical protein
MLRSDRLPNCMHWCNGRASELSKGSEAGQDEGTRFILSSECAHNYVVQQHELQGLSCSGR